MPYDFSQGIPDAANIIAGAFSNINQENKDKQFLEWLQGLNTQHQGAQAARIPDAPPPAPPVQGPALPAGYEEPDPSVAPTSVEPAGTPSRQGGSAGVPYSNEALTDYNSLLEGRKAAATTLFQDPAQTLNILIEAKRRGAGPGVGGVLDFITSQHKASAASAEKEKDRKARGELEKKRAQGRATSEEARRRLQEKLAKMADETRRRGQNMAGKRGKLDEQDMEAMTDEQLDALEAELEVQAKGVGAPDQSTYDSYDDIDRIQYREDYDRYSNDSSEIGKLQRMIARVRALRKPLSGPGRPSAGRASAAPQAPVQIRTQEEWSKLPPGTRYIGPDGQEATKR